MDWITLRFINEVCDLVPVVIIYLSVGCAGYVGYRYYCR
jgi:hypothetical protein